jgi:hypothetical protein
MTAVLRRPPQITGNLSRVPAGGLPLLHLSLHGAGAYSRIVRSLVPDRPTELSVTGTSLNSWRRFSPIRNPSHPQFGNLYLQTWIYVWELVDVLEFRWDASNSGGRLKSFRLTLAHELTNRRRSTLCSFQSRPLISTSIFGDSQRSSRRRHGHFCHSPSREHLRGLDIDRCHRTVLSCPIFFATNVPEYQVGSS